jgi:hypothetical protein
VTDTLYADITSMGAESSAPADDWSDITDEKVTTRPSTGRSAPSGARRGRKPAAKKIEALQSRLSEQLNFIGFMMGLGLPVTGYYINQESSSFIGAVLTLAQSRPDVLHMLERMADIQPGITIARFAIGCGAAIAVDRERVEPDKRLLQFLGVTQAYMALHEPGASTEEGSAYAPPPSQFQPV